MSISAESYALARAGNEALRRGDFLVARDCFDRATYANAADVEAWLGLATSLRALNESQRAFAAIDRALALAPRSFRALIAKADLYADEGDARAASTHYTAAIRHAPPQLPPEQQGEVRRAHQMCDHYKRVYESHLREKLAVEGFDPLRSSSRFTQSLDLMMGRKKIFLQEPRQYYFPGLPQVQFYEREKFPWLDAVESATDDIVAELEGLLHDGAEFRPYVERETDRPLINNNAMTDNADWTALYLQKNGMTVAENAARCPKTIQALRDVPECAIAGRTPSVLFSRLRPGSRIPPHNGFINARLICHLPLIVPDGCGLRVGNDVRSFRKGEAWVFDDTIEHEAWNDSAEPRIILLFEIWHPELSEEERALVAALIQATASYAGGQLPWTA